MRGTRWFTRTALLGALALVAAACARQAAPPAAEEDPCAKDPFGCVEYGPGEPIRLGTLLAISGDVAFLGTDSVHGVELAIDFLDGTLDGKNGQLLGHDVELVQEDDGCNAEAGQAGATKLAADPTIVAVIGTSCSSAALGVADRILSEKGILLFSPSNTNPNLTAEGIHQPFYARTAHNDKIQGAVVANFAYDELGARTAATINDESPYADALAAVFRDNFEAKGGTITAVEAIQSTDTDFKPLLTSIAKDQPDVLYFPDFNPACALITKQGRGIAGLEDTAFIGSDGCLDPSFLETAGDAAVGAYASGPDLSAFQQGDFYKNEFLPQYKESFGTEPTAAFHAHAFDAANVLFQAIEQVAVQGEDGSLRIPRTALKDAVLSTSGYQGLTGTITCTPLGDCATDVTIAVFKAPDWPVEGGNPNAKPVFSQTLSLEEVGG
jgi:branched-chain amino acid transport system substrate-binding protein